MSYRHRILNSISATGLICALTMFCFSLSPSLLPRDHIVQGILSGVVFAVGYFIGLAGYGLWNFMGLKNLSNRRARFVSWILLSVVVIINVITLKRLTIWQNSIRLRMEMMPIDTAYTVTVISVAFVTAVVIILLVYLLLAAANKSVQTIGRFLPRRIAIVTGSTLLIILLFFLVNGIIVKNAISFMDESFAAINKLLDSEYPAPLDSRSSGSADSFILWEDIGRNGKKFITDGPKKVEISNLLGRQATQPIRIYAGYDTGETLAERAETVLAEMKRVDAFSRSVLIVATPTGTGWLDPSAIDTVEYLHHGDIATVTLQYSYLPSWLTLMVEPDLARQAGSALLNTIYGYWTTLPHDKRPEFYLHGLSLGALGSADSAELISIIGDPVNGALWSGPPFMSRTWNALTRGRNSESPQWRPIFRDSSMFRFMTQDGFADLQDAEWGPLRIVYLQHASDPMSFFSTSLAYSRPDWYSSNRGRDVSPYLKWFPLVSFFQIAFDIPMATSVPLGYGHNFAPEQYIEAWIEVTQPQNWHPDDTIKLKKHFTDFNLNPL